MTLIPAFDVAPELSCGDPREARRDANRRVDEARAWGTSRAIGVALHAAALADEGSCRLRLLHEATAALEDSPARLEYARAAIDLGAVLRSANRRSDARAPLRRALDVAVGCGAPALARRARRELRAAGGRPRSARTTGIESLTGSEQRVASMAADGLSNPEIAQALFVTKKTVETHLAGVYRKLGIRGRGQLQAILRNLGGGT